MSTKIKFPTEKEKAEGLILDYALDNNMYPVIQAFTAKGPQYLLAYRESAIPDGRIFSPTIHAIIEREDVQHFHKVIKMLKLMYGKHPEAVPIRKFSKILTILKMKVMLYVLSKESQFSILFSKLDEYFPVREFDTCIPTSVIEKEYIQSIHMTCRRAFGTIILSQSDEKIHAKECLEKKYGRKFMQKFQSSIRDFLQKFKACLPIPILQEVVNEAQCSQSYNHLSVSPISLLDSLFFKCSQSAPSETWLLSVLDKLWSSDDKYNDQSEYVGESQIFNFLCLGSSMSSQATQGGSVVSQLLSQLDSASQNFLNESSDSSPNATSQNVLYKSSDSSRIANSPSLLKRYKEDSNKCYGELADSVRSSESSKSTRIFRKTWADSIMSQNERLGNATIKVSGNVDLREQNVPENTHSQQPKEHVSNNEDSLLEFNFNDGNHEAQHNMSTSSIQKTFFFVLADGTDHTSEHPVKLFVTPKNISMSNVVDVLCEVLETCTSDICSKSHDDLPMKMLNNPEQSGRFGESDLNNPEERESLFEFFNCYSEDEQNPNASNDPSVKESESLPGTSETNFSRSRKVDPEDGTDLALPVRGQASQATGHIHYPKQLADGIEKPSEHQLDLDINNTNLDELYLRFSPGYVSTQFGDVSLDTIEPKENNDDNEGKKTGQLWRHRCGRTTEPLDLSAVSAEMSF
ncbi:uncharacterized protein LOC117107560 [Anneissia japonica]|uniref:uncharacterized protein LOC117107560 n=1 Tax=Anneissia japonica TaxID=1529436 RepID=UPI00142578C7|nr:uncharacterized protein LOC117107560 [Anneissia japonica]